MKQLLANSNVYKKIFFLTNLIICNLIYTSCAMPKFIVLSRFCSYIKILKFQSFDRENEDRGYLPFSWKFDEILSLVNLQIRAKNSHDSVSMLSRFGAMAKNSEISSLTLKMNVKDINNLVIVH